MTEQAKRILADFQVRKSFAGKRAFRAWLRAQLEGAGYTVTEERGLFSGTNLIAGETEGARVLFTAHYDTCAVLPIPNFITPRSLGWYLLYQLVIVAVFLLAVALVSVCAGVVGYLADLPVLVGMLPGWLTCLFLLWWMFFGRANRHTANDNTSGVITLLEAALALPSEERGGVCFVFFDNEERGLLGSSAFAGKHKELKRSALVVNFDCVSDGEALQLFPTKALKGDPAALEALERSFLPEDGKTVEVVRGFGFYPSDNLSFTRGVGVCALKKGRRVGWYMDRIHTGRDTVFEEKNIALLVRGVLRLVREMALCPGEKG